MRVKIGELARLTGCQVVTIRFYEKEGLLPAPSRSEGNYRLYGEEAVERLNFIRHCRHHGMKLSEIRELLAFRDNPRPDCGWINTMIAGHIAALDEQIATLTHLRGHLRTLLEKCSGHGTGECAIVKSLNEAGNCPYCEDPRRCAEAMAGGRKEDQDKARSFR